eukprot:jgi/Bigna1/68850/fgenesh1_pg.7_\
MTPQRTLQGHHFLMRQRISPCLDEETDWKLCGRIAIVYRPSPSLRTKFPFWDVAAGMVDYPLYNELTPDVRYALAWICGTVAFFFAVAHTCHEFYGSHHYTRACQEECASAELFRTALGNADILSRFIALYLVAVISRISIEMRPSAPPQHVDPYNQTRLFRRILWWYLHAFFLPVGVISAFASAAKGNAWINSFEGQNVCGSTIPVAVFGFLAATDVLCSISCLSLFVYFLWRVFRDSKKSQKNFWVIARNLIWGLLSMASTATTFLQLRSVVFTILGADVTINVLCVNLIWPFSFYATVIRKTMIAWCGDSRIWRIPLLSNFSKEVKGYKSKNGGVLSAQPGAELASQSGSSVFYESKYAPPSMLRQVDEEDRAESRIVKFGEATSDNGEVDGKVHGKQQLGIIPDEMDD